ncbi:uncharacterized protein LOC114394431 [Glycine soja]|uniref:uncharacterized protein LOC114394431 n=1 Tax=Glycine soja TaxID=3848 RepID=UPI00103E5B48|nr:uncharacterized protein LOC114394431 [Glycine soja]
MHLYLYTDILFYFIFHSYPNCPLYFLSQSLSISCCVVCFSSLPISCNQPQQQQPRYIRPCRCPFLYFNLSDDCQFILRDKDQLRLNKVVLLKTRKAPEKRVKFAAKAAKRDKMQPTVVPWS